MTNSIRYIIVLLILMLFYFDSIGQRKCGAEESYDQLIKIDPDFVRNRQKQERIYNEFIRNGGSRSMQMRQSELLTPVYTIPVVVHVLWNSLETIVSWQQIQSQIDVLNRDFQLLNSDANLTPSVFLDERANCQISFCLAKKDPNGIPTDGIVYKQTTKSQFSNVLNDAKLTILDGDDAWDRDRYLNIWVVPKLVKIGGGEIYGDASSPGSPAFLDGVVIGYKYFGTQGTAEAPWNLGRTTTHEVGHWLDLNHIWGDPIPSCLDFDGVEDTPNQYTDNADLFYPEDNNHFHLTPFIPKISCNNGPDGEMFMNYMDYTQDAGMNMFTIGQKDRMFALFQPGGVRFPLISSQTCVGIPDLRIVETSTIPSSVIAGNSIVVNFKERNDGSETAGSNYINIHLSQDDILTPGLNGDIYLDQYFVDQNINAFSQSTMLSKSISIPASIAPGTYYIIFAADGMGAVNEFDEYNNFASVVITIAGACADLIVLDHSLTPLSCIPGNSVTVFFKEKNIGDLDAGSNYVNFHLSPDNNLTPGLNGDIYLDQYFVSQAISTLSQTDLLSKEIVIPASVAPGIYYIFFAADGQWEIGECNNNNNLASAMITVSGGDASLVSYRYWFDNQFSNNVTVNGSFGNDHIFQASIATNLLQSGLHSFTIGFKETNKWSSFTSSFFYKLNPFYPAGSAKYEYWFDNQFDNRTNVYLLNASDLIVLDNFNTNTLVTGLHTFNIRLKPDSKHWSSTITSFFYKLDPVVDPNNKITKYRYWFDNSFNETITVNLNTPVNNLLFMDNLCTSNLSIGNHQVHFQFMNSAKQWSSVLSSVFYKDELVATEVCDGIDNNCNGQIDEGFDVDNDGYSVCSGDCNDNDSNVHPNAVEVCDGIDNNCNGQIDEGVKNTYYHDADGDGYGNAAITTQSCTAPSGYVTNNLDCNDGSADIHPGATEICNGIDDDCDGQVDEEVKTTFYRDADGDGYGNASMTIQACAVPSGYVSNNSDCNDGDATVYPGSVEICGNGVDEDCDSQIDEGCTGPVTITVLDATVLESAGPAIVTVSLSNTSNITVTVKYKTANGTAKSPKDYTATSGTLTFSPGQISKTISVPVIVDNNTEGTETFFISLSKPTNATIMDGNAIVSIIESSPGLTRTNRNQTFERDISDQSSIIVPNPQHKNELLRVFGIELGRFDLILIDVNGKEALKIKNYRNNWSMARLTPGIYFYHILYRTEIGELQRKIGKIFITD